ncbi:MAG: hypothetical protein KDI32_12040 [Pseudomonadales bacterium]|nr:hypothetical protein [Pseudomonadales bacterium]
MRNRLRNIGIVAALLLSCNATAEVTRCDRLATHPDDPYRNTAGLESGEMDLVAAEQACRDAVASDARRARSQYHLGRVLYYSGKVDESLQHLTIAADAGYPQAIFVLGYILADGKAKRDDCRAGELFLRGVALEHPWSGAHLVEKALDNRFDQCAFKLSDNDLERAMRLAEDHVTLTASAGRIEKLRARLNARVAPAAAPAKQVTP